MRLLAFEKLEQRTEHLVGLPWRKVEGRWTVEDISADRHLWSG
jgi:hypothetical protein